MSNLDEATKNDETETEPAERIYGFAKPADPETASEDEADDFEAAAAKAKAFIGNAHAVMDKLHGDLMNAEWVIPGERETSAAYSEGAMAFYRALQYVELLVDYRSEERRRAAVASSLGLSVEAVVAEERKTGEKLQPALAKTSPKAKKTAKKGRAS